MPFESPDWRLDDLLKSVSTGDIQLPDFQRTFKWDDERISSLLASVSRGYPIGVVMTLETGGDGSRFKWRPLQGVAAPAHQRRPSLMLLDGQQRLTSLFQALMSDQPVQTTDSRGMTIERWYYIDIIKALDENGDREDAITSLPRDRKIRQDFGRKVVADYSTDTAECAAGLFPLRLAFEPNAREDWSDRYKAQSAEHRQAWQNFRNKVLDEITKYMVPLIKLGKETPKEAVCTVFEKVNTGGVQLTVFELLTATFAGDRGYYEAHGRDFELGDDWKKIRARLLGQDVLASFATEAGNPAFLQAISLLATRQRRLDYVQPSGLASQPPAISCKRADLLRIRLSEYTQWREVLVEAFKWCGRFLNQEKIFHSKDLPYPSQLVPLAVLRAILGRKADNRGVYRKLRQWFWCGVLGELYGGATESRFARDVEQVYGWVAEDGVEPETVSLATFHQNRLLTLTSRNSAAYKGLYALIMAEGCEDWMRHQRLDFATFHEFKVDLHHIFPKEWCRKNGIKARTAESIVNKTAIAYDTNRAIGDRSPADYLPYLEKRGNIPSDVMDGLIASHCISSVHLRSGDFQSFFDDRVVRLLNLVEAAIGKPVVRIQEAPTAEDPQTFPDETDGDASNT